MRRFAVGSLVGLVAILFFACSSSTGEGEPAPSSPQAGAGGVGAATGIGGAGGAGVLTGAGDAGALTGTGGVPADAGAGGARTDAGAGGAPGDAGASRGSAEAGAGGAGTPSVADNPPIPAGWKLMMQSEVTPDMTTWAVGILDDVADYPMFATAMMTFGGLSVLARVEWHAPDFTNELVHRGVTLYEPS